MDVKSKSIYCILYKYIINNLKLKNYFEFFSYKVLLLYISVVHLQSTNLVYLIP